VCVGWCRLRGYGGDWGVYIAEFGDLGSLSMNITAFADFWGLYAIGDCLVVACIVTGIDVE